LSQGAAALLVGGAVLTGLLLPVDGFMTNHAGAGLFDAGIVRWLDSRAAFRDGAEPVAVGPVEIAVFTGARLAHPLVLISEHEPCAALEGRSRSSWLVLGRGSAAEPESPRWIACLAGQRPVYLDPGFAVYAPPALAAPAAQSTAGRAAETPAARP
jgi:hypothetical protein